MAWSEKAVSHACTAYHTAIHHGLSEFAAMSRALDAAAAVDGDAQWKPIETAPKAGRFLIGGPTITGRTPPWRIEIVSYRDKSGTPIMSDDLFEATHWMPPPRRHPLTKARLK